MSTTSALRTQMSQSAQDNNGQPWSDLECAAEVIKNAASGIGTPVTLTPLSTHVTTSGTVAAGNHYVEFAISPDFAGTINGITYSGTTSGGRVFPNIYPNVYPAINYTVTTGYIDITVF